MSGAIVTRFTRSRGERRGGIGRLDGLPRSSPNKQGTTARSAPANADTTTGTNRANRVKGRGMASKAEPAVRAGDVALGSMSKDELLELYRQMVLIRRFEEKSAESLSTMTEPFPELTRIQNANLILQIQIRRKVFSSQSKEFIMINKTLISVINLHGQYAF